jgi:hypothetical protein
MDGAAGTVQDEPTAGWSDFSLFFILAKKPDSRKAKVDFALIC